MGALATALLLAALAASTLERGLTAQLDAEAIARDMRPAIETQVAAVLPAIIDELKRQTPARVSQSLATMLADARIEVYGVEIRLPPEAVRGVQGQIEGVVARELARSLDGIDVEASARQWGAEGERLMAEALRRHLRGRSFRIGLGSPRAWLSVPVTIDPR